MPNPGFNPFKFDAFISSPQFSLNADYDTHNILIMCFFVIWLLLALFVFFIGVELYDMRKEQLERRRALQELELSDALFNDSRCRG